MKKWIFFLFLVLICFLSSAPAASALTFALDGVPQKVYTALYKDSTYVPLRAVSLLFAPQAEIRWTGSRAEVQTDRLFLSARPGDLYIEANGRFLYAADGVKLVDGSTLVPLRALAAAFGGTVAWDGKSGTAHAFRGSGAILPGSRFYREDEVFWLGRIIQAEAGGEPLLGKIAVGNVVLNRVHSAAYPNTIYGVIFDRKGGVQFEPVLNGTIYNTPSADSLLAAKLCLDGARPVGGCLFFFNPALASSNWISKNRPYYTSIGRHEFYL